MIKQAMDVAYLLINKDNFPFVYLGEWAIAVHGMYESHEVSLVLM